MGCWVLQFLIGEPNFEDVIIRVDRAYFPRCMYTWHYTYYFISIKFLIWHDSKMIYCRPFIIVWYEVLFLTRCLLVSKNECPICWLCDFELIRNILNIVFIFVLSQQAEWGNINVSFQVYVTFWMLAKEVVCGVINI